MDRNCNCCRSAIWVCHLHFTSFVAWRLGVRLLTPRVRCVRWQVSVVGNRFLRLIVRQGRVFIRLDRGRNRRWRVGLGFAVNVDRNCNCCRSAIWVCHLHFTSFVAWRLGVRLLTPRVRCVRWQVSVVGNRFLRLIVRQGRVFIRLDRGRNRRWRVCLYINISIVVRH